MLHKRYYLIFLAFFLFKLCVTVEVNLKILPFYNQGMNSAIFKKTELISEIQDATVSYSDANDLFNVTILYFNRVKEFFASYTLNGSTYLASVRSYSLAKKSDITPNVYTAFFSIKPIRPYGACILSFKVNISNAEVHAQFLVNLRSPSLRLFEMECPSFVYVYPSMNIMTINLRIVTALPMNIPWEQITVFKRIVVKRKPSLSFIHMPLAIVTRSTLMPIPLMLWSNGHTSFKLADKEQLIIQSTSAEPVGKAEVGDYIIRWTLPDNQHLIDLLSCHGITQDVVKPKAPLVGFRVKSGPWSFDKKFLNDKNGIKLEMVCIFTDVYQEKQDENYKKILYSEGDDLGFLTYTHSLVFNKTKYNLTVCRSDAMYNKNDAFLAIAPKNKNKLIIPTRRIKHIYHDLIRVYPTVVFVGESINIVCFDGVLDALKENQTAHTDRFNRESIESLKLDGQIHGQMVWLLEFKSSLPEIRVNREYVTSASAFKWKKVFSNVTFSAQLEASNFSRFSAFRCSLNFEERVTEPFVEFYKKPICVLNRTARINIVVNNLAIPLQPINIQADITKVHVYRLSCLPPGSTLEVICHHGQLLNTCVNQPLLKHEFDVQAKVLIHTSMSVIEFFPTENNHEGYSIWKAQNLSKSWHEATLVCQQDVYRKPDRQSKNHNLIYTQYSTALRICVSHTAFNFYSLNDGFTAELGLISPDINFISKLSTLTPLIPGDLVNDIVERSGLLCEVVTMDTMQETIMEITSVDDESRIIDNRFMYDKLVLFILPEYKTGQTNLLKIFCSANKHMTGVSMSSKEIQIRITRTSVAREKNVSLIPLFVGILITDMLGMLVAYLCPLLILMLDKRFDRQTSLVADTANDTANENRLSALRKTLSDARSSLVTVLGFGIHQDAAFMAINNQTMNPFTIHANPIEDIEEIEEEEK